MQRSYAVYWNEGTGARYAGRLEVEPGFAQLAGRAAHGARALFRIVDIASVRYSCGRVEIERNGHPLLEIGSVDAPGALREAADRLQAAVLPT